MQGLPSPVQALFDRAERHDFEAGLDWYANLVRTVFGTDEPEVHVLYRNDEAVAALPLLRGRDRWGPELKALGNYYTSRYAPPVADGVTAEELAWLFRSLRVARPRLRSLTLAPLDHEAPQFKLIRRAMSLSGLVPFDYFCFGNWHLPVTGTGAQYLQGRPGEVRSTLKRMSRRFDAQGGRIEILSAVADLDRAVQAYGAVYETSWKSPEPHPDFMPGLMRLCAERGWMRLGVAWLGERPIAAQLWVVAHGRASIYKLAYDAGQARLSPGTLLTAALMRHVHDVDRVEEIDYLTGDDAYKRDWMSHRRERWGLIAFDPLMPAGAWGVARESASRVLRPLLTPLRRARADAGDTGG